MVGAEFFKFWTVLLHLSDFEVAHVYEDAELKRLFITVIPTHRIGVCPTCGRACDEVKQRRTREGIQDLPIGCNAVELKVRVDQFECQHCEKCFTPLIPFLAEGAHATERFMERAAQLIRKSDIANAAQFLGVAEKTLANWYYDYVERLQQQPPASAPLKPIRRVGIDELSLKKSSDNSSR
jgi:transposase